jgi:hypothetical protein
MNADEEDDDEREFAPAEEIVFRLDTVMDCLDTVERILGNSDDLVIPDADRRQMRAILDEMSKQADELFDLATTVAHLQTTIKGGTN